MLGFYIIAALVASYSLCISGLIPYECVHQHRLECDQTLRPQEFPTTVDQLRDNCRDMQQLGGCILKVFERCTEADQVNLYQQYLDYIHSICDENSEVFQAISSNLQCIASNARTIYESCHEPSSFSEPTIKLIQSLYQYANKSEVESYRPDNWCLETLWLAYCPSTKAAISCGFEVGAAVKDILLQTSGHIDPQLCSPEFLAEVTPMLEAIEVAIVEEENLKKMEESEEEPPAEQARRKKRFASCPSCRS